MEDFKDVMLSEPPQRFAGGQPSNVTSNALSLESYKGILLCDRPADTRAARAANQPPPFLPPGNTDLDRGNGNLGLQPSAESRAKQTVNRSTRGETTSRAKSTALTKHRKWLTSFASEMKKMKVYQTDIQIQQTVREASLREREAAKRRGERTLTGAAAPAAAASTVPAVDEPVSAAEAPEPSAASASSAPKAVSKKAKSKAKAKPKWAMTEEEAEDAEFDEARELMDFAADLDYDTYIKDFEVQEALAIMRDRVREIAVENGIDIDKEREERQRDDDEVSVATVSTTTGGAARSRASKSKKKAAAGQDDGDDEGGRPGWDDSTSTVMRKAIAGDALKLAERVLQTSDSLRKVHSKMSMAKLLEDVAMEIDAGRTQRQVALPAEAAIVAPRVAMVAAEATGDHTGAPQPAKRVLTEMRHSKSKAQNLPYLYRCPSI